APYRKKIMGIHANLGDRCVQVYDSWHDVSCSVGAGYICEKGRDLCPKGWTPSHPSGTCIKRYEQEATWSEARQICKQDGGDLVTILNADMNQFISDLCPKGWTPSHPSGTCIKRYEQEATWSEARQICQQDGGDLVTILNADMNQFIGEQKFPEVQNGLWIGLKREGQYRWLDHADEVNYTNWKDKTYRSSDIRYPMGQSSCVVFSSQSTWTVADCKSRREFICERFSDCINQQYGTVCPMDCSSTHCGGPWKECNQRTGVCDSGCEIGYTGPKCDTGSNTPSPPSPSLTF
ncbi:macrophage mannose receptor 1, partial [Elysia marginata]